MCSVSGNGEECSEVVEGASVMMNRSVGAAHQGLNEWRNLFWKKKTEASLDVADYTVMRKW
jgi:hypothetical protein